MSSSQPFEASSPISPRTLRQRKSRFTYRHLAQLASYSAQCPIRVIAHIDLDAFYAQCEMVRLGVSEDQPLAVQQWQGLIAINYPARKYGLNRFVTITEAQKACPDIILQHVATWKEGDEKWQYHEDAFKHIATHKVSLDPYRRQSRRILGLIKDTLPAGPLQRVEKASVDEVFLDLSAQVHGILLQRFPELQGPVPYDDPTENLPRPPSTVLDWNADALIDLDDGQSEEQDPDWDDVAMNIGSEIVRGVRTMIRQELQYTCSAGIARNKMLSKLGSGYKKPNSQTIVRNRAVQHFLSSFRFTKIRNLGGKLGEEVVSMFNTEEVSELLKVSLDQLKRLGDDTGSWLYQTIRGEDYSEVNPRTQIKSMLSAKSFRPSINTFEQGIRWIRIFVADIFSRLVEEGVTENKRRPKTINLHHRQGGQTRSKQAPIPQGRTINEELLFDIAKNLLAQIVVDGRAWPCANLSLSVGGFEDGPTGNKGIGGFLVRGDEAKALQEASRPDTPVPNSEVCPPAKKRRIDDSHINDFFHRFDESDRHDANESETAEFEDVQSAQKADERESPQPSLSSGGHKLEKAVSRTGADSREAGEETDLAPRFTCDICQRSMLLDQREEHQDWHFAQNLQQLENQRPTSSTQSRAPPQPIPKPQKSTKARGRPPASAGARRDGTKGVEKGQSRLAF